MLFIFWILHYLWLSHLWNEAKWNGRDPAVYFPKVFYYSKACFPKEALKNAMNEAFILVKHPIYKSSAVKYEWTEIKETKLDVQIFSLTISYIGILKDVH